MLRYGEAIKRCFKPVINSSSDTVKRWVTWAAKIACRKGIPADPNICAYRFPQTVHSVTPFGGGYMFYSSSCQGCSNLGFNGERHGKHYCALLASPLFTLRKVSKGQTVDLNSH